MKMLPLILTLASALIHSACDRCASQNDEPSRGRSINEKVENDGTITRTTTDDDGHRGKKVVTERLPAKKTP